jgi:voltage-gated potassium channel
MPHLTQSIMKLYYVLAKTSWVSIVAMITAHASISYIGLTVAGEADILNPITFIYFYATTAYTIGYGDFSPTTDLGRLFAAIWIFPGALLVFSGLLAKLTQYFAVKWSKRMQGYGDYSNLEGATVIIGYNARQTNRMISEMHSGKTQVGDIIVVSDCDIPVQKFGFHFVRTENLSSVEDLKRSGVMKAARIVIYCQNDDVTFSAAMAAAALNGKAHLVVYLDDDNKAAILQAHTQAICVINQSAEIVVREMEDPGVSSVFTDLTSARTNVTIYSIPCPEIAGTITAQRAHMGFRKLGATFIGSKGEDDVLPTLNMGAMDPVNFRTLFYIASKRISVSDLAMTL